MLNRVGIRELRDRLTAIMRRVRAGEPIEITHDGKPVALLSPLPADRIDRLVAGGDVSPAASLTGPLQRFPVTRSLTASEAMEEDRAEA